MTPLPIMFTRLFALVPVAVAAVTQNVNVNATLGNGVYNSSTTPSGLPWNTYNYCNAPHVQAAHYVLPSNASAVHAQLEHLTVVMRHHKARHSSALLRSRKENRAEGNFSVHQTTCTRTRTR
jgi:hypothetical protein